MSAPDTIVLIHGFWVTPRSWENWVSHYEQRGFRVLAPAYPGFEVEVESLHADPSPVEKITIPEIVAHLESVVGALDTPPEDEARALFERYAVPVSGSILFESALANLTPGHQGTWVDYSNGDRAPLLFVAGTQDNIMPPKVQWSNAAHYRSDKTLTRVVEFGDMPHLLPAAPGWEEIADYVLAWALRNARR
jgi:pimeloyl-ACP methyl ester carboxylesterase